jgi:exosortase
MKRMASRGAVAAGFVILAWAVWRRVPWGEDAAELVPALAAFPLYLWICAPWRWRSERARVAVWSWVWPVGLFVIGAAVDHTLVMAVGWTGLWRTWLRTEVEAGSLAVAPSALLLLVCGFPWLGLEGQALGWWFRYSGAWAAAGLFGAAGFDVVRDGTFLTVQGLPLAVDAACSGLHALQSMLVAGTLLALLNLAGARFWLGVALLPGLAWLANVMRIVTLGVAGLSYGPEAALGWFHEWGGLAVLLLMFLLCMAVFRVMRVGGETEAPA